MAAKAFQRIGYKGDMDVHYKGSMAFAGCTGPTERFWSTAEIRPRYRGPAIVAQIIPTPAAQAGEDDSSNDAYGVVGMMTMVHGVVYCYSS